MNKRQKAQQEFDASSENLIVGREEHCPVSVEELASITEKSPYVVKVIRSGLTAEIFHLRIDGKEYNLKKRRSKAKVDNLDGKYSFLNEVQCRKVLQQLQQDTESSARFANVVPTIYANYRLGILLSPWIQGEHIQQLTPSFIEQLFSTLLACEEQGLMEWDLCGGNMLVDSKQKLWLFDFGYMYPFDPKTEFNSNGVSDPLFHMVERFETRFFFGWLLESTLSHSQQLDLYRQLKQIAIRTYGKKLCWLKANQADTEVITHFEGIVSTWVSALSDERSLENLFYLESFRSHVLDIEDDIEGKSCTPLTLKRIDEVEAVLSNNFNYIAEHGGLFYVNEGKSQDTLMKVYAEKRVLALQYQL